jgi:cupin superfamily acireductone dioxygenase involved in methionine salvage
MDGLALLQVKQTPIQLHLLPNADSPKNVIMADWEDLIQVPSNIYYQTTGTCSK